jgi:hypothetical protein
VNVTTQLRLLDQLRPSELFPAVQTLLAALKALNLTRTTYVNQASAATTTCAQYALDTARLVPPIVEASARAFVGGSMYQFGE